MNRLSGNLLLLGLKRPNGLKYLNPSRLLTTSLTKSSLVTFPSANRIDLSFTSNLRFSAVLSNACRSYATYDIRKSMDEIRKDLPDEVRELAKDYPSLSVFPVKWGDMDSFKHVNNVSYALYVETGRTDYFENIFHKNLSDDQYQSFRGPTAVGPIVKSVFIKYKAPTVYPDIITVAVTVPRETIQTDRFVQKTIIISHEQKRVVAEAETVIVTFDYKANKKAPIPKYILEAYEKGNVVPK